MALTLYGITMFLSAALLFMVQPFFARLVLPFLGGTPAVWTTCVMFFQTVMLVGYLYVHVGSRWLGLKRQVLAHVALLAVAFSTLPVSIPADWQAPSASTPVFALLGLLTVSLGLPVVGLAATSPLLQQWFAGSGHPRASDPYFLYAASNLGSMVALLGYPAIVEPQLGLDQQSRFWAGGSFLFLALIVASGVWAWRRQSVDETSADASRESPVGWKTRIRWCVLAFVPSSWMLGVTTHMTTDIAPVPWLWVVPLVLYLLSYILAFLRRSIASVDQLVWLFPYAVMLLAVAGIIRDSGAVLVVHLGVFSLGAWLCHRMLAAERPPASRLTEFYLALSVGGLLGGVLNSLIAPACFPWLIEYPLTVMVACLLPRSLQAFPDSDNSRRWSVAGLVIFALCIAGLLSDAEFRGIENLRHGVLISIPVLLLAYLADIRSVFAIGIGAVLVTETVLPPWSAEVVFQERSFFGVHRVIRDPNGTRWLFHGRVAHGVQNRDGLPCEPLAYYHRGGPLGHFFHHSVESDDSIAIVGLGAGAALCYQRPGQTVDIYELDPVVVRVAEDAEYFTYLSDCSTGHYTVHLGDGRQQLAFADDQSYDVMLFDAFSSDAIPVHLLTRESLELYRQKLRPGGRMIFHITNSYLDLEPVLANLAKDIDWRCFIGEVAVSDRDLEQGTLSATYAVLVPESGLLGGLNGVTGWREALTDPKSPVWTDDYCNVLGIFRW